MDASYRSDVNDSQRTQLVEELIENNSVSDHSESTKMDALRRQLNNSSGFSAHSLMSSGDLSSQYHFHGLASTQSESQSGHLSVDDGVSQKENTRTAAAASEPTQLISSRPSSPHVSSYRHGHESKQKASSPNNSKFTTSACANKSTRPVPMKQAAIGAGHPSLAMKTFNITSGVSYGFYRRPASPPTGRVLVEATPEHSQESVARDNSPQQLSQQLEATQLVEENEQFHPYHQGKDSRQDDGYGSTSPSSSYGRMLDGKGDVELEATQPSTQVADVSPDNWNVERSIVTFPDGPSGNRTSLLGLVPPGNRHRYLELAQRYTKAPPGHASGVQRQISVLACDPTHAGPSFDSRGKLIVRPSVDVTGPSVNFKPLVRSPSPLSDMDVVPDSTGDMDLDVPVKSYLPPKYPRVDASARDTGGLVKPEVEEIRNKSTAGLRSEDDDMDDEDDLPLAAVVKNRKDKDRLPVQSKLGTTQSSASSSRHPNTHSRGKKILPIPAPTRPSRGRIAIPSSVPEEPGQPSKPTSQQTTRWGKKTVTHAKRRRPPTRLSAVKTIKRLRKGAENDDDDDESTLDVSVSSDAAEEEYESVEAEDRKRKRGKKTGTTGETSKRAKRGVTSAHIRSHPSTNKTGVSRGTSVVALWKQDGQYYPGVVHATMGDGTYHIRFSDDTEAFVTRQQMRLCDLRIGDDVLLPNCPRPGRIVSVGKNGSVGVKGYDGKVASYPISCLRIANKTIVHAWKDRTLEHCSIVPTIQRKKMEPSASKLSTPASGSGHTNNGDPKILGHTGIIITLSSLDITRVREMEKLLGSLEKARAIVVDDFDCVIGMEPRLNTSRTSWLFKRSHFHWIGRSDIKRLFLVADSAVLKPKYLMAIALGVPCLSVDWIYDSVAMGEELDWSHYLLDQGYCEHLNTRLSQQIDLDWGDSVEFLRQIMENQAPSNLFAGMAVVCVGSDMVPPNTKGKRKASDEKGTKSPPFAHVIIAMGAETVETISAAQYASKPFDRYDYVVLKNQDDYSDEVSECPNVVDWQWVKESLIASRFLPPPEWTRSAEARSQEV